jgi:hypothetical protein
VHERFWLTRISEDANWDNEFRVVCGDKQSTFRLVHKPQEAVTGSEAAQVLEEVVVSVQGIVYERKELPPFLKQLSYCNFLTLAIN